MISPKVSGFDFSYLEKLIESANEHHAINLISPHPSFGCADVLKEAIAQEAVRDVNQPVKLFGNLELREKIAGVLKNNYGHVYLPETEMAITGGINQSVFAAITSLVREGDQVIVFEPTMMNVVPTIELCGGQPVYIRLKEPGFFVDWEDVQKMITNKTRMILLGSPHNPTGWTMAELDAIRLQRIINGTKIVVLSDESFQHVVFDGEAHQSMAAYPKLAEQSILIASLSDAYRMSAWPMAYMAAPAELMKEVRKVLQIMAQCVNSPIQRALAKVVEDRGLLSGESEFYQNKRDKFLEALDGSKFTFTPSKGSCFQVLGINGATSLPDKEFAQELLQHHGVAVTPLSLFNHEKTKSQFFRIDLTQPDDVLIEGARRLKEA